MELFKKLAIAVAGAVASYYATKTVKAALERKPLKARVRDGKAKVVDLKDTALDKVNDLKSAATEKVTSAADKAKSLYDGGEDGYNHKDPE